MKAVHKIEIPIDDAIIAKACRAYGVTRLWLFGSIVSGRLRPDSDVDVLIELGEPIGMFRLGGLQAELSDLLGRTVHLTTLDSVPERTRSTLLRKSELVYPQTAHSHG